MVLFIDTYIQLSQSHYTNTKPRNNYVYVSFISLTNIDWLTDWLIDLLIRNDSWMKFVFQVYFC